MVLRKLMCLFSHTLLHLCLKHSRYIVLELFREGEKFIWGGLMGNMVTWILLELN